MSVQTLDQTVETAAPSLLRRVLPLAGAALVLALAAGWWLLGTADAAEDPTAHDGEIVELPAMTTTVGERGIQHARVGLAIVLTEDADPGEIEPRQPLLQDALLRELARLDADEVRSSEGSDLLRERLSEQAQDIWGDDVVRRVLLTELMVQ
jgi:flagellar basal body-associated protein FliL